MKKHEEKGITLINLVIIVIVLTILAGIGISSGKNSVQASKYTIYQTELKVIQTKINEITKQYQKENKQIGIELRSADEQVLNAPEVVEQLTKKAQDAGNTLEEIKNGFRLCTVEYIQQTLGIENITRDYLVNLQKCIVVSAEVFEYDGINYYMLEQMENGLYNVTYRDQVSKEGNFTIETKQVGEEYEITINPIHEKYVSKWQIKYKLQDSTYWKTTNDLTFRVDKTGIYEIQVTHRDEIDLGTKTVTIE